VEETDRDFIKDLLLDADPADFQSPVEIQNRSENIQEKAENSKIDPEPSLEGKIVTPIIPSAKGKFESPLGKSTSDHAEGNNSQLNNGVIHFNKHGAGNFESYNGESCNVSPVSEIVFLFCKKII